MKSDYMLRNSVLVFSASLVAAIFSYLFNIFMARRLGPAEYGRLATVLSIFLFVSVSITVIGLIITRYTAYFKAKSQLYKVSQLLVASFKVLTLSGVVMLAVVLLLGGRLAGLLGLSMSHMALLGILLLAFLVLSGFLAVLSGMQLFKSIGLIKILEAAMNLALGVVLVNIGLGSAGAVAAMAISTFLTIPACIIALHDVLRVRKSDLGQLNLLSYLGKAALFYSCLSLILNIDIVIVKHFFSAQDAGFYAATSMLGSLIFFVSSAVASIIFPKAAELHSNGKSASHLLKLGMLYMILSSAAMSAALLLFPSQIVSRVFGPGYNITGIVGIYTVAMSFLGIANILVVYHIAIKSFRKLKALIPFAAAVFAGLLFVSKAASSGLLGGSLMPVVLFHLVADGLLLLSMLKDSEQELKEALSNKGGYLPAPYKNPFRFKEEF